ncbi:uncharacterized protein LOC132308772 [Cornus florida]|uniref:uncharacterized protein LOC132308772 n=1 Tax=Cornus florida TaxID=4283 RepID=UPI00289EDB9C|nr:uncharacterized protein LOC132308772 [Cornus florida]
MTTTREPIPPPIIGKAGRYTIFLTPPSTPKPSETTTTPKTHEQSPKNVAVLPPPVQPPPQHFGRPVSGSSKFGFLSDAAAKVKNAHSNLDEYIANWFGLNQSKYQWALDDYFETKAVGNEDAKAKVMAGKGQSV